MLRPTSPMKSARKKPTAAKLRSWRVSIIRKRGQYLGTVEAARGVGAELARGPMRITAAGGGRSEMMHS